MNKDIQKLYKEINNLSLLSDKSKKWLCLLIDQAYASGKLDGAMEVSKIFDKDQKDAN